MVLELPRRPAAAREDRRTIAVGTVLAEGQRLLQVGDPDHGQYRPENLVAGDLHGWLHPVQHTRPEQKTVPLLFDLATVQGDRGPFLAADVQVAAHALQVL